MGNYILLGHEQYMAKKKTDVDEELAGEEENLSELKAEDAAIATPVKVSKPAAKVTVVSQDDLVDKLSDELEGERKHKDYRYLKVAIEEVNPNEYYVIVHDQSHGLMNYMVTKLLKISGVVFAAYKYTSLDPPTIYIRTDGSKDIKSILKEAIKQMRIDWSGMKNAVAAMKL